MEQSLTISTDDQPSKPWLFGPGNNANPRGRPPGSRNKLGEQFVAALQDDFVEHGPQVIERVRKEQPAQYLKVIAAVIPKEFHIKDQTFEGVSDAEFAKFVDAVRAVLGPSAESAARVIEGRAEAVVEAQSDSLHAVDLPALSTSDVPPDDS